MNSFFLLETSNYYTNRPWQCQSKLQGHRIFGFVYYKTEFSIFTSLFSLVSPRVFLTSPFFCLNITKKEALITNHPSLKLPQLAWPLYFWAIICSSANLKREKEEKRAEVELFISFFLSEPSLLQISQLVAYELRDSLACELPGAVRQTRHICALLPFLSDLANTTPIWKWQISTRKKVLIV